MVLAPWTAGDVIASHLAFPLTVDATFGLPCGFVSFWQGYLFEVFVWTVALSAAELGTLQVLHHTVTLLGSRTLPPPCPVGWRGGYAWVWYFVYYCLVLMEHSGYVSWCPDVPGQQVLHHVPQHRAVEHRRAIWQLLQSQRHLHWGR